MWRSRLPLDRASLVIASLAYCLAIASPSAYCTESSTGPRSEEEARILWNRAENDYRDGKCEDALSSLRRLVDRYPGHPDAANYRLARFQLGHCYFALGKDAQAITELKPYLEGAGDHPNADRAREMICKSQLRLKKPHEAYLTSEELEKSIDPAFKTRALTLRAQALIAMNQDDRAGAATASALTLTHSLKSPEILGDVQVVQLELMTRSCARHPATGRKALDEASVEREIQARAVCLNEALVQFRKVLAAETASSSDRAVSLMEDGFKSYQKLVENPPPPPKLKPKDRSALQRKRYMDELKDRLRLVYENERKSALQMITNWKQETPVPTELIQKHLESLEESLK